MYNATVYELSPPHQIPVLGKSLRGFITGQWHCPAWWN